MVKSMTGYGKGQLLSEGREITVELRTVNSRYLDLYLKLPRSIAFIEDKARQLISTQIARGKAEISVNIKTIEDSGKRVIVDLDLANSYLDVFSQLAERYKLENDVTVSTLLSKDELFKVERPPEDEQAIWQDIKTALCQGLDELDGMRIREGERIKADLNSRADYILSVAENIAELYPQIIEDYKNRLWQKIKDSIEGAIQIDEGRILTEIAIFADKTCMDEEIIRLKSHIEEFKNTLQKGGTVGRRLDFIIQELNREINTVGSKCNDLVVSRLVVDVKTELEKLREQIQNIE